MKISKLNSMFRGWFIGNFEPCSYKTKDFEVGILEHKKNEVWPKHYHKIATEINCLISGKMIINNCEINEGDIFVLEPNEIAEPIFLEDCKLVVVKTPSVIGDKYEV